MKTPAILSACTILVVAFTTNALAAEASQGAWQVQKWNIDVASLRPSAEGFEDAYVPDERIAITLNSTDGRAQLVVFHQLHELNVYIKWNEFIDDGPATKSPHTIAVKYWLDGGDGRRENWLVSNAMQATAYPGLVNLLLRDLVNAQSFRVRVTPYGANFVEHTFALAGLRETLHEFDGHYDYTTTRSRPSSE